MVNKVLKALYGSDKTPLVLGEVSLPCYVLEDGTRVFSGRGLQNAVGANPNASGTWLSKFVNGDAIVNNLAPETKHKFDNPIPFTRTTASGSQSNTNGYEVTLLIDLCDAIIRAFESREYTISEAHYNAANAIIRAVAKVGIIALVDEATGYQYDREKDELQRILKAYISEELLPWQKRFPDIFYKELFRLNGWDFTVGGIKKRPGVIGKWTNALIYKQLPKGVLEELKSKTPRSAKGNYTSRFHQHLTLDTGAPGLTAQITKVLTLFRLSDNMEQVWDLFRRLQDREHGQLEFSFEFDNDGHTANAEEDVKTLTN